MLIRSLFLLLISFGLVNAQSQSALYKIEGNGLEQPSYLFGTINFLPKFGYIIPKEVQEAIASSKVFVTKSALDRKSQQKFNEAVKIPEDGTVDQYLSEDEVRQLRSIIEKYGGRNQAYNNFYNKLQPVILLTSTTALTLQYNVVYPIRELQELGQDNKLKFNSLSNVDEEIEAFKQFPAQDQIEALKIAINDFDEHLRGYRRMVRAYMKEQKLDVVTDETLKATNNSEVFKKAYFDDRSKAWLPQIKKFMNGNPTFFAIGVPHMTGDNGLVNLLKAEGYSVEPVVLDFVPAKTSN